MAARELGADQHADLAAADEEQRRAFDNGEFEVFFQPQVRLNTRRIFGAEALLRWRHPQRGLMPPAAFMSVLEAGPLASVIGLWSLRVSCAMAAAARATGLEDFRVGVNLFGAQFREGDLVADVTWALDEFDLPPDALELEVTENIALDHEETMVAPLRALRSLGVGVAFDDYGTGYASLSLLKRYPVTKLKIDQSFVRNVVSDAGDAAVVQVVLYLGERFNLDVIAEGIEDQEQEDKLREYGCMEGQGFFYSRPISGDDMLGLLASPSVRYQAAAARW